MGRRTNASPYRDPALETLDRAGLERLQLERLQRTVARAARSPHYRRVFREAGIDPRAIRSLADAARLPFTVKDDLRDERNFPWGFLTVPRSRLVRLHSSSGTTGRGPTMDMSPRSTLNNWGSSSRLVRRRNRPTRVTRGSSSGGSL